GAVRDRRRGEPVEQDAAVGGGDRQAVSLDRRREAAAHVDRNGDGGEGLGGRAAGDQEGEEARAGAHDREIRAEARRGKPGGERAARAEDGSRGCATLPA